MYTFNILLIFMILFNLLFFLKKGCIDQISNEDNCRCSLDDYVTFVPQGGLRDYKKIY